MNELRVSVATYDQVVFPHPENGTSLLALERKARVGEDGSVSIRAQPFGGGVRILDPNPLKDLLGELRFDSQRSEQEMDFRILIPSMQWDAVKRYCLLHLADPAEPEIESTPDRELVEEFEETMGVDLRPGQYRVESIGFSVEDQPVWTENWYARGFPTVRVYRTYKVQIVDEALCKTILSTHRGTSDRDLANCALERTGRASSVLVLPLNAVLETYLALPPEKRYTRIKVEGYELDESVLAVLGEVDVPQYCRR